MLCMRITIRMTTHKEPFDFSFKPNVPFNDLRKVLIKLLAYYSAPTAQICSPQFESQGVFITLILLLPSSTVIAEF